MNKNLTIRKNIFHFLDIFHILSNLLKNPIAKNILSLYSIQFAGYILPLISVPFLVRILGPQAYGTVAFAQSLIAYFTLFINYGFDLSATRSISIQRDDREKLDQIVSNILGAKFLFFIIGFIILFILLLFIPTLNQKLSIIIILYALTIGNIFFPTWLYQGMERMIFISIINIILQIISLICIFVFIHQPQDYIKYAVIISSTSIAAGATGLITALIVFKLNIRFPSLKGIWKAIVEGNSLFLANVSGYLYVVGNSFILGLITNNTVLVGYYSAAEKIINAFRGLFSPVTQALYPRFSKIADQSKTAVLLSSKKIFIIFIILGLILFLILFFGASIIVNLILGTEYLNSSIIIQILSFIPLLIGISSVSGILIMLTLHHDKMLTLILFCAGIINIILAILLVPIYQIPGMAYAVLLSEFCVVVLQLIYLQKRYSIFSIFGKTKLNTIKL